MRVCTACSVCNSWYTAEQKLTLTSCAAALQHSAIISHISVWTTSTGQHSQFLRCCICMCILVYVFLLFSSCVMVIRPPSPGLLVSPLPRCSITPQGASRLPGAPTFITSSLSSDIELILIHLTFTMLQIKVTVVALRIKISVGLLLFFLVHNR